MSERQLRSFVMAIGYTEIYAEFGTVSPEPSFES
jgi:hypothetical protein